MPILKDITVTNVRQVWQSPDGQRTINEVTMDYEGKEFKANTFSDNIAVEGWKGDVETYDKPGKQGSQTFVKQAPKKDDGYGGQPSTAIRPSGSSYVPKDEKAIQAMFAIKAAVALVAGSGDLLEDE